MSSLISPDELQGLDWVSGIQNRRKVTFEDLESKLENLEGERPGLQRTLEFIEEEGANNSDNIFPDDAEAVNILCGDKLLESGEDLYESSKAALPYYGAEVIPEEKRYEKQKQVADRLYDVGKQQENLSMLELAAETFNKLGDEKEKTVCSDMAWIYFQNNDHEKAIDYAKRSEDENISAVIGKGITEKELNENGIKNLDYIKRITSELNVPYHEIKETIDNAFLNKPNDDGEDEERKQQGLQNLESGVKAIETLTDKRGIEEYHLKIDDISGNIEHRPEVLLVEENDTFAEAARSIDGWDVTQVRTYREAESALQEKDYDHVLISSFIHYGGNPQGRFNKYLDRVPEGYGMELLKLSNGFLDLVQNENNMDRPEAEKEICERMGIPVNEDFIPELGKMYSDIYFNYLEGEDSNQMPYGLFLALEMKEQGRDDFAMAFGDYKEWIDITQGDTKFDYSAQVSPTEERTIDAENGIYECAGIVRKASPDYDCKKGDSNPSKEDFFEDIRHSTFTTTQDDLFEDLVKDVASKRGLPIWRGSKGEKAQPSYWAEIAYDLIRR